MSLQPNNSIQVPMHMPPQSGVRHSQLGPILAILIIVILLIFCGLYIWGGMLVRDAGVSEQVQLQNTEPAAPTTQTETDSLDTLEAELMSTDFSSIDAEIRNIDIELDAALTR